VSGGTAVGNQAEAQKLLGDLAEALGGHALSRTRNEPILLDWPRGPRRYFSSMNPPMNIASTPEA
jgi:hypothetical protein